MPIKKAGEPKHNKAGAEDQIEQRNDKDSLREYDQTDEKAVSFGVHGFFSVSRQSSQWAPSCAA